MGIPRAQELVIGCHSKVESTSELNERIANCKPEKQNLQYKYLVRSNVDIEAILSVSFTNAN